MLTLITHQSWTDCRFKLPKKIDQHSETLGDNSTKRHQHKFLPGHKTLTEGDMVGLSVGDIVLLISSWSNKVMRVSNFFVRIAG